MSESSDSRSYTPRYFARRGDPLEGQELAATRRVGEVFVERGFVSAQDLDAALEVHPLGRSPALETEDGPLFESSALILHIADLHPEAGLLGPVGSYSRGLQYQWCFFGMTEIESALMEIARQVWSEGEPIEEVVDAATARFVKATGVVVAALGDREYLVDDRFSVADIVVGSVLAFARTSKVTELPDDVEDYVDRLEARPARERAVAVALPA